MTRRLVSLAAALVAVLPLVVGVAGPAAPAAAAPVIGPNVQWLAPAPGEVVSDGQVYLRAVAASDRNIRDVRLRLDGQAVAATVSGPATERKIAATVAVGAGDHIATVEFSDDSGRTYSRAWRFTATTIELARYGGSDRVDTAVQLSRRTFGDGQAQAAVLARADGFADALAGVPLAAAEDAALLLTWPDRLPEATAAELRRAVPDGGRVHVLGGTAAVAPSVVQAVEGLGYEVVRHAGPTREATAAAVARAMPGADAAVLASASSFPDALAVSAPAARHGLPILLTGSDRLAPAAADALGDLDISHVVVVGGSGVVSADVLSEAERITGSAERVAGRDRYATAVEVVERFYARGDQRPDRVALASGRDFPDALAGARHAVAVGQPLLLSDPQGLPLPVEGLLRTVRPGTIVAYGGEAAIAEHVVRAGRRASLEGHERPIITDVSPPEGAVVGQLDTIVVEFDRELALADSTLYVEIDGREVLGVVEQGDFTSTLVFQVGKLTFEPEPDRAYDVSVRVLAHDGAGRWLHDELRFTYVKRELARGDVGGSVLALQQRLEALGYWVGTADGTYGSLTTQAVMAFEKEHGLPRDGVSDDRVRELLATAGRPSARSEYGHVIEFDKARQILKIVHNGTVQWAFNSSSGTEEYYYHEGERRLATTPTGRFEIFRQIDGMRDAPLGKLWRPKYFNGGIALHGSTSVPAYPASHGCVRVTYPAIDFIWAQDLAPVGTPVWVY